MIQIAMTPTTLVGLTVAMRDGLVTEATIGDTGGERQALILNTDNVRPALETVDDGGVINLGIVNHRFNEDPECLTDVTLEYPDDGPTGGWIEEHGRANLDDFLPKDRWDLTEEDEAELIAACDKLREVAARLEVPHFVVLCRKRDDEGVTLTEAYSTGAHFNKEDGLVESLVQGLESLKNPHAAMQKMLERMGQRAPVAN